MKAELKSYLNRIGYDGSLDVNEETLQGVHRAHALSVPYENVDVYLQRPVDRDIARIRDKIVTRRRGGWCYEMNGLLSWALGEIGFCVTQHCGGVQLDPDAPPTIGDHLVLTVDLGDTWLADVGVGDFSLVPLRLEEGEQGEGHRQIRIENIGDKTWRCHNREGALPPAFEFSQTSADGALLDTVGQGLQEDVTSLFRENLICMQMTEDGAHVLFGRVYTPAAGGEAQLLNSEDELLTVLNDVYGIEVGPQETLWELVTQRHEALFGPDPA